MCVCVCVCVWPCTERAWHACTCRAAGGLNTEPTSATNAACLLSPAGQLAKPGASPMPAWPLEESPKLSFQVAEMNFRANLKIKKWRKFPWPSIPAPETARETTIECVAVEPKALRQAKEKSVCQASTHPHRIVI